MNPEKFVFCEGLDDVAVVKGLAAQARIDGLRVEPYQGKDQLRDFLRKVKTRPEFSRNEVAAIAILRDADNSMKASFQSVCDALGANGFPAPEANGVFASGQPKVGVFVVGLNGRGMIEDLCLESVSGKRAFRCVDEYFNCVRRNSDRAAFSSKAKVRVWMSSQVDFDIRVGLAAQKGYWPLENKVFEPLRVFLRQV
jgi:hypothetical protein